jgi:flagellar protein FlgJ
MKTNTFYSNQILTAQTESVKALNKTSIGRVAVHKVTAARSERVEKTPKTSEKRDPEINKVAQKFESIFLKELLKNMRKTVPKSGFLNGGWTEEFYWDMLNQELSERMADVGGIGLAEMIYQQMSRSMK